MKVDPANTQSTQKAWMIVNYMEHFWKPFMSGKTKAKLSNVQIMGAANAMALHIPRMDPLFPIPKRINAKKLKDWTDPFLEDMEALYDDMKEAADEAKKKAAAGAMKKKLADAKAKAKEDKLKAEVEKKKAAKAKLEGNKKEEKKAKKNAALAEA